MMKNTMIKVFSVLAVALCMTACGNKSGTSDKSVTTTTSETLTTTTGPVVTTTVATVTNEPEEVVTTTISSSSEDTTTTTEPTATSDVDSEVSTTTTTPKVTTTKKPTTVTTTTTKKKATTTTTAKKSTPTTTTTPKPTTTPEVTTTTTAFVPLITQDEIDKLVVELQKYSNSVYENLSGYNPYDEEWYVEKETGYGFDTVTYAEYLKRKTPNNSSWEAPDTVSPKYHTYAQALSFEKEMIDLMYKEIDNVVFIVYSQYYPNGINGDRDYGSWEIYLLY